VAEHFDVRIADMTSKRARRTSRSRGRSRCISRVSSRSFAQRNRRRVSAGRDHGTVLHACKLVKKRMLEQANIRQTVSFIDSSLQR
jgi:chromosomal replication initiator protein